MSLSITYADAELVGLAVVGVGQLAATVRALTESSKDRREREALRKEVEEQRLVLLKEVQELRLRARVDEYAPFESPTRGLSFDERERMSIIVEVIMEEEERSNVELSRWARSMLFLPVAEQLANDEDIKIEQVRESVRSMLAAMAEVGDPLYTSRRRSTVSVIRAFWARFCDIPPFCKKTGHGPVRS
jgi:hypothetical protein